MHNKLQRPLTLKVTRALFTLDDGTPFCLVIQKGNGHVSVCRAGDKDFAAQLEYNGIHRSVVVSPYDFRAGSSNILQPKEE
jgi:hypothetical protein